MLAWIERDLGTSLILNRMLVDNEAKWLAALKSDLNKPYQESCLSEIDFLKNELISLRRNIRTWAKDQ